VNFFLKQFPSTEWSGPAWYKPHFKKDEAYPTGFTLIHFHPVDLGHGTATVIEAEDTAKILEKTWRDYPETEKCMMGIIHSHHTMGAFFSGTDDSCLEDNAPIENFYCSTVVASKKDKFAFGCSYQDQYGRVHLDKADEADIQLKLPADTEESKWKYIAKKIKDAKKETTTVGFYGRGGRYNQGSFFEHQGTRTQVSNRAINGYGYPINYTEEDNPDQKVLDKLNKQADKLEDPDAGYLSLIMEAFNKKELSYESFRDELVDMGLNPVDYLDGFSDQIELDSLGPTKEVDDVIIVS